MTSLHMIFALPPPQSKTLFMSIVLLLAVFIMSMLLHFFKAFAVLNDYRNGLQYWLIKTY